MTRLSIDLTEQQHKSIKAMAALQGKSIKEYAVERLFPVSSEEEQALDTLRGLLEQRLAEANRGEVSAKSMTEVAEESIRALGTA